MLHIIHVISDVDRAVNFEWLVEHLPAEKYHLEFVLLNRQEDSYLQSYLRNRGIPVRTILLRDRSDYFRVFFSLFLHFLQSRAHIVHTHLTPASLLGITSAWLSGVKRRIITRHHSTYHHEFAPHFLKYEKIINFLATDIIAISQNVKNILEKRENVPPGKISLIHTAFDLNCFSEINEERINLLKLKYELQGFFPIVGVISRFIKWKGIQFILPAFQRLLNDHPNAVLVLANANGPDSDWIHSLLLEIPKRNLRIIPFERDIFALYRLFDVFVHVPIDSECEAHGQVYIEALAAGIPSIFTLSGIATEFVKDGKNAMVVDFQSSDSIYEALRKIVERKVDVKALAGAGKESVKKFEFSKIFEKIDREYSNGDR